jgi:hypothetical protein
MKYGRIRITKELLLELLRLDNVQDYTLTWAGIVAGQCLEIEVCSQKATFPGETLREGEVPPVLTIETVLRGRKK